MTAVSTSNETLKTRATDMKDRVQDSMHHVVDRAEVKIHRHPLQSVLVTAGAGVALGFVLGFLAGHKRQP
jgi:ElaB/YqjD/DUF883 family membrane-anchored ribosome-binding protein